MLRQAQVVAGVSRRFFAGRGVCNPVRTFHRGMSVRLVQVGKIKYKLGFRIGTDEKLRFSRLKTHLPASFPNRTDLSFNGKMVSGLNFL